MLIARSLPGRRTTIEVIGAEPPHVEPVEARADRRFFSEVYDHYRKFEVESEDITELQGESEKEGTDREARLEQEEKEFLEQQRSCSRGSGARGTSHAGSTRKLESPQSEQKN